MQGPDGDEITFAGQRGVFNNISLDGGDYNNGFFGEQMGGQRAAIDITLEAVKEFQVVATGANAEFGRTAGGVVNVITKSGTNELHGSLFHFQRLEALTSNTSDGKPLDRLPPRAVRRHPGRADQEGQGLLLLAFEHINENLQRPNLSGALRHPARWPPPISAATRRSSTATPIASAWPCSTSSARARARKRACPSTTPINNTALLAKLDWTAQPQPQPAPSRTTSTTRRTTTRPSTCATYGNSANGTEGPSKIHVLNLNLFSTLSPTKLNEFHFTYSREVRPRAAVDSNVPADTAMGFATTFRFGNPFFLQPNVDETSGARSSRTTSRSSRAGTRSRSAASGCTRSTTRSSAASSRAATSSTA